MNAILEKPPISGSFLAASLAMDRAPRLLNPFVPLDQAYYTTGSCP